MYHVTTLSAWRVATALVAAGLLAAGCSSASSSPTSTSSGSGATAPTASGGTTLMTGHTSLGTTLENSKGFVVYWFAKDHGMSSSCSGACAAAWPPVTGTPTAGSGVTGTLSTIHRSDGSTQATWNGHPLYTFSGDTSPGQTNGNGVNGFGGLWYAITMSGHSSGGMPSNSPSSGSGGGYGY